MKHDCQRCCVNHCRPPPPPRARLFQDLGILQGVPDGWTSSPCSPPFGCVFEKVLCAGLQICVGEGLKHQPLAAANVIKSGV